MNIAFFSAVRYDSVIGGRTRRLCDELSRRYTVHFVEMPSLRHPCFSRKSKVSNNIFRYQLLSFPKLWNHFDSLWGQWWSKQMSVFLNQNLPNDTQAIVSTPFWVPLLRKLKIQSVTYDCLDHLSVQSRGKKKASQMETELLNMANQIVCVSSNLANFMQEKTKKPIHVISNGFPEDYLQERVIYPEEAAAGFCGAMYEWFDFSLIEEAASALSNVHFILTGPVRNSKKLKKLYHISNVEINPSIPFSKVKQEIQRYSVGMIPFLRDEISYFCNPIKMYEYSALGKPIISTVKADDKILPVSYAKDNNVFISELNRLVHTSYKMKFDRTEFRKYSWNNVAKDFERILK